MSVAGASTQVSFTNILFPTDFSIHSSAALVYGMAIARRYKSTIHALHVIAPSSQGVSPELMGTSFQEVVQAAKTQMRETELRIGMVPHNSAIREGEVWRNVSETLQKERVDLIVMGTHGRTGLLRVLMGSVAEQIYRQAACPVLTVGPHASLVVPQEIELSRILYATDFSTPSLVAAPYALSLAQEHEACLTLMHVIEKAAIAVPDRERISAQFEQRLLELLPSNANAWCQPGAAVEYGAAAQQILYVAAERKANLIVLGVRKPGHPALMPHLPGSVSSRVVAEAKCPVLTVRSGA